MRRRELVAALPAVAVAGCTIGGDPPSADGGDFSLEIPGVGGELPERYTCDGVGESPPLRAEQVPEGAAAIAVAGEWLRGYTPQTIWLLWGLPADDPFELPAGIPSGERVETPIEAIQGTNDEERVGYRSPCHETADDQAYRFIAFALPEPLDIAPGAGRDAFDDAIERDLSNVSTTTVQVRYERFEEPD